MEDLFNLKRKLNAWYEVKVLVQDYSKATTRNENGKVYIYPACLEIKIENWSNHFYSFRLHDSRFVQEGESLTGRGLTATQLYKLMAKEAKAFARHKDKHATSQALSLVNR